MIATQLYAFMEEQLRQAPTQFHCYAYPQIEWEGRLTGIGGRNKGKKQIQDIADAFVVKDDIEYGNGNVIPLWHSGMNY